MKLRYGLSALAILVLFGAGCASSNQNLDQTPVTDDQSAAGQTLPTTLGQDQNATSSTTAATSTQDGKSGEVTTSTSDLSAQ